MDKEDRGNKDKIATKDYSRWKRQNKMGLQKVGEEENTNLVNRAKNNFQNKFTRMRFYNQGTEQQQNVKGVRSELRTTNEILKVFIIIYLFKFNIFIYSLFFRLKRKRGMTN